MSDEVLKILGVVVAMIVTTGGAFFALKVVLRRDNSASKNQLNAGDNATQVVVGGDFKGDIQKND